MWTCRNPWLPQKHALRLGEWMKKIKEFPLNGVELSTNYHRKLQLARLTCWSRLSFPFRRQVAVSVCLEMMRTLTSSSFSINQRRNREENTLQTPKLCGFNHAVGFQKVTSRMAAAWNQNQGRITGREVKNLSWCDEPLRIMKKIVASLLRTLPFSRNVRKSHMYPPCLRSGRGESAQGSFHGQVISQFMISNLCTVRK